MKTPTPSLFNRALSLFVLVMASAGGASAQTTPDIVWSTNAHNRSVLAVAFSADSALLASGSIDRTTRVWRLSNRSISHTFLTVGWSSALAFSRDLSLLGAGDGYGNLFIWRLADGTRILGGRDADDDSNHSVIFSPDNRLFARAAVESGLRFIISVQAPPGFTALPFDYPEDAMAAYDVRFSPDGTVLAAGFDDHSAKLFRMSDGTRLRDLLGHSGNVTSVDFSPDGTRLATAATDGDARLWHVADGALERVIRGGGSEFTSFGVTPLGRARFSADGKSLVTLSNGAVRVWSVSDGRLLVTYQNLEAFSIAVSPDGKYFAYGTGSPYGTNAAVVVARMPLFITNISRANGQLILGWSGGSGRYQLQETTNIATGPWQSAGFPTTASGATNPVSSTIFYRVQNLSNP